MDGFIRGFAVVIFPLVLGCGSGVPVSQVAVIELKRASDQPADGMVPLRLYGTERDVYVAESPLLTNEDIATVEKAYDSQGERALVLHFTDVGAQQIRDFTRTESDTMIALVVDGTLMLALPVRSEIGNSAMISGNTAQVEIDRIVGMRLRPLLAVVQVWSDSTEGEDTCHH